MSGLVANHDRLYTVRDRAQVVVAAIAFDPLCVRVDREHLIAAREAALYTALLP
jgi:hypothetical protein